MKTKQITLTQDQPPLRKVSSGNFTENPSCDAYTQDGFDCQNSAFVVVERGSPPIPRFYCRKHTRKSWIDLLES